MRRTMIFLGLIVFGLALGFTPAALAGTFAFTTFDVPFTPFPPPVNTDGLGINIHGLIVGNYADSNGNNDHGYLRDAAGRFTRIDVPFTGAFDTTPFDINVTGVIVGQYRNAPGLAGLHCFILVGGLFTTLDVQGPGFPHAFNTGCRGINASGQVVGRFRDSITRHRHGFLFSGDAFTQIDFPGATHTIAREINNHGQIAGWYITDPAADRSHGFFRDAAGQFSKIDFPGAIETFVGGINDRGQIVGSYVDSGNIAHGFLFANGVYTTVPLPGVPQNMGNFTIDSANFSTAIERINDNGEIAGEFLGADGNFHGFLGTRVP